MGLDVRLLYVEDFTIKEAMPTMGGIKEHFPKTGRVYRAIKRRLHKRDMYQILYDERGEENTQGIFIPALNVDNPFYSCSMRELSIDDLLDLDLKDEAYRRIANWGHDYTEGITQDILNAAIVQDEVPDVSMTLDNFADKIAERLQAKTHREVATRPQESFTPQPSAIDMLEQLTQTYHQLLFGILKQQFNERN